MRRPFNRFRAALPAACGIGIAAVAGWLIAGGGLPSSDMPFSQPDAAALHGWPGGVPVHIGSTPAGAQIRIDAARYGKTPLDVRLSPGQHALSLEHPDALDDIRVFDVPEAGANVDVALWRRQPEVLPIRPVYPGAELVDARLLEDGQVALLVSEPTRAGAASPSRELWRLDPATGRLGRVIIPGLNAPASTMSLAPDGEHVAYATPGSAVVVSTSLWAVSGTTRAGTNQQNPNDTVWIAPVDGSLAPWRIFDVPSVSGAPPKTNPERISDLVWTPDGSRLVVITRQAGPPARARIVLLNAAAHDEPDTETDATELLLLPAEILPGSATSDPGGRWLALLSHAAAAPGGSDLLNLCVLQLRPDGIFRDVADLGAASRTPGAPPIAWAPGDGTSGASDRLVFVGPAPPPPASNGGLLDMFGALSALRTSSTSPSALFLASLEPSGLNTARARRIGAATNTVGPVWRSESVLYGFARQDDGALTLRSIDPASGATHDTGVRLPSTTGQGVGLGARWDPRRGSALLLAHRPNGTTTSPSLQAWLVSFQQPSSTVGAPG